MTADWAGWRRARWAHRAHRRCARSSAISSPSTTSISTSEPGEFFSLLGPSGCGKTTTLRMIAGFEQPTAGQILPRRRRPRRHAAASPAGQHRVPVLRAVPPPVVDDNVGFGLRWRRDIDKADRRRRVARGDRARAARRVREAATGAAVGWSAATRRARPRPSCSQPSVLLLDEPLGALDAKLRKELQHELAALQREVGITFVYVTHDQEEALTMSDRLAVMDGGHVAQVGTPERGVRAAGDRVRRRLPRRRQPARRRAANAAHRGQRRRYGWASSPRRHRRRHERAGQARDPARTGA